MDPVTHDVDISPIADEKYIVFKRERFHTMMGYLALPPWRNRDTGELVGTDLPCAPLADEILHEVDREMINDAVVIRRQDMFAAPALATYASMIAMAAKGQSDPEVAARLLGVADYFQQQSEAAAEEGWKLPD